MEYAIETRGLTKTYKGKLTALSALDLRVPAGSAYGLLGPNGAGKSTLVKTLLSIVRPTAGEATLLGVDCREARARKSVGYLPESPRFPRYLTGRGVCLYFGKLSGLHGNTLKREVDEKLALTGMSEWAHLKVTKYSKGMAQRIGLAQALLGNPKLVFLDEPTDGVDPVGRKEIRDIIKRVCAAGTTVFLNSHLLSEVEQVCGRIAILNHGKLLREGTPAEVAASLDTGSGVLVNFLTGHLPPELWQRYQKAGAAVEPDGSFNIRLPDEGAISGVVDELRVAKVDIYGIGQRHLGLEDAFINLITAEGGSSVGGVQQ